MVELEAKFDAAKTAAGRIGRKDWLLLFFGVMFTVIDNSLGRGKSKLSDLDSVPDISKNVPELKEKLSEALEQARDERRRRKRQTNVQKRASGLCYIEF